MSNVTPVVSVVMSVYNGADTLRETMDSILSQQSIQIELIVVDDGSRDASGDVLDALAARDQRVRVIHQANEGLTKSLVRGCALARAELIARHDCGDLSKPQRMGEQAALFETCPTLTLAGCSTEFVGPAGEHLYTLRGTGAAWQPADVLDVDEQCLMRDGPTHHGSVMFRRRAYETVGGYRPEFYYGQDWDLWYRLAEVGTFQSLDKILYVARIHPDSISSAAREPQEVLARLSCEALRARRRGESDAGILMRARAVGPARSKSFYYRGHGLYFIGETLRRNGDPRARNYLRDAIGAYPLLAKAWVRYLQVLVKRGRA